MTARENSYAVSFFCIAGLSPKKGYKVLKDSWHQGKQQIARENTPQVFLRSVMFAVPATARKKGVDVIRQGQEKCIRHTARDCESSKNICVHTYMVRT